MKFRLTYDGQLDSNGSATHKHEIRKVLHPQLRELCGVLPNFNKTAMSVGQGDNTVKKYSVVEWAIHNAKYARNGYNFIPIAESDHDVLVSLEILFLRRDRPGNLIQRGDIDNRLKTLFDGLRMPTNAEELGSYIKPSSDEEPFFVLLEDDQQITKIAVETDTLLAPLPRQPHPRRNDARLIITVELDPRLTRIGENDHFR